MYIYLYVTVVLCCAVCKKYAESVFSKEFVDDGYYTVDHCALDVKPCITVLGKTLPREFPHMVTTTHPNNNSNLPYCYPVPFESNFILYKFIAFYWAQALREYSN